MNGATEYFGVKYSATEVSEWHLLCWTRGKSLVILTEDISHSSS